MILMKMKKRISLKQSTKNLRDQRVTTILSLRQDIHKEGSTIREGPDKGKEVKGQLTELLDNLTIINKTLIIETIISDKVIFQTIII